MRRSLLSIQSTALLAILFSALCTVATPLFAERAIPELHSRVTDEAGLLSTEVKDRLEARLKALEEAKGAQLAVLTIQSLEGEVLEEYSLRVAETWKLGRKDVDDGILLLVAVDDRKVRIEVGYGLEGILPDASCRRILDETILPEFRGGDFESGIEAGVEQIAKTIEGGELPEVEAVPVMEALMAYNGVPDGKWIAGPFSMFVIGIFTFMMIFHKEMPFAFMYPFLLIFWTVFPLVIFGFAVWKYLIGFYLIGVPILRIFAPRIPGLKRISEGVSSNVSYSGGSGWSSSSGSSGFSGGGGSFGGGGSSGSW